MNREGYYNLADVERIDRAEVERNAVPTPAIGSRCLEKKRSSKRSEGKRNGETAKENRRA